MIQPGGNENWKFERFPSNSAAEKFGAGSRFVELWQKKKQKRQMPSWNDYQLEEFFEWNGRIMVLDIIPTPFDARVRLWGTKLVDVLGYDRTGMLLSEIDIPDIEMDIQYYKELCEKPCIGSRNGPINWAHRQHVNVSHLDLPLSSDGHTADKILSLFDHNIIEE
ncbi:MAG: PAS domain-containing protein [Planctomycetes bacterium]|nr:PAS domain-containing protein [Planctomycetota bacterium]